MTYPNAIQQYVFLLAAEPTWSLWRSDTDLRVTFPAHQFVAVHGSEALFADRTLLRPRPDVSQVLEQAADEAVFRVFVTRFPRSSAVLTGDFMQCQAKSFRRSSISPGIVAPSLAFVKSPISYSYPAPLLLLLLTP